MSEELLDFGEMAMHLAERSTHTFHVLQEGLEHIGEVIEHRAKGMFGVYQPAAGAFGAWPELADSTKEERVRLGFTENDPLLRSGDLRESVEHSVDGLEVAIGSRNEVMRYQELGTNSIPPRPVLGPAAFLSHDIISRYAGWAGVAAFTGRNRLVGMGYDANLRPPDLNAGNWLP